MSGFEHGYALLIGVNENAEPRWALPTVAKDVAALQNVLTHPERCAYPPDNIKVLTGQAATRQGILDGLSWLQERIRADASGNATAIVYYSGHGWVDTSANPNEFYLIPYDLKEPVKSRALRASDFAAEIDALKPQRLLVILDCCHAGGMGVKDIQPLPGGYVEAALAPAFLLKGAPAEGPGAKGMQTLMQGAGRAVISSSKESQPSHIRKDGAMSIFTYHLIEALTGHAQPQEGASEVLVSDVMSHVWRRVPTSARADWGARQEPDYMLTGNFPIALLLGGKGLKGQPAPDPLEMTGSITVNTGGGAFVGGSVSTGGGDFVGRDKIIIHAPSPMTYPPVTPEGVNTAALRELLTAAFDDQELTTLCFDHFRPVYEMFAAGTSKPQKVHWLIDYCVRQGEINRLLAIVQQQNPRQYERFAGRLRI